jgi:hypothetical protein
MIMIFDNETIQGFKNEFNKRATEIARKSLVPDMSFVENRKRVAGALTNLWCEILGLNKMPKGCISVETAISLANIGQELVRERVKCFDGPYRFGELIDELQKQQSELIRMAVAADPELPKNNLFNIARAIIVKVQELFIDAGDWRQIYQHAAFEFLKFFIEKNKRMLWSRGASKEKLVEDLDRFGKEMCIDAQFSASVNLKELYRQIHPDIVLYGSTEPLTALKNVLRAPDRPEFFIFAVEGNDGHIKVFGDKLKQAITPDMIEFGKYNGKEWGIIVHQPGGRQYDLVFKYSQKVQFTRAKGVPQPERSAIQSDRMSDADFADWCENEDPYYGI